jgi:hypothetical protein
VRSRNRNFAGGVGAQFPVSTGVFDKVYPAIAALGADYLAVWEDNRIGPDPDIFGARITAAGVGANFSVWVLPDCSKAALIESRALPLTISLPCNGLGNYSIS